MELANVYKIIKIEASLASTDCLNAKDEFNHVFNMIDYVINYNDYGKNKSSDDNFYDNLDKILIYLKKSPTKNRLTGKLSLGILKLYIKSFKKYKNKKNYELKRLKKGLNNLLNEIRKDLEVKCKSINEEYEHHRSKFDYLSANGISKPVLDINKELVLLANILKEEEISIRYIYQIVGLIIKFNSKFYSNNINKFNDLPDDIQEKISACFVLNDIFDEEGKVIANDDLYTIIDSLNILFDDNIIKNEANRVKYRKYELSKNNILAFYYGSLLKANTTQNKSETLLQRKKEDVKLKDKNQLLRRKKAILELNKYYDGENIIKSCDMDYLSNILNTIGFEDYYKNNIMKKMRLFLNEEKYSKCPKIITNPLHKDLYVKALDQEDINVKNILEDINVALSLYADASVDEKNIIMVELNDLFYSLENYFKTEENKDLKMRI